MKTTIGILICVKLAIVFFILGCWVSNLVQLIDLDFEAPYKAEIVRGVGLVPIVSCVTAFMELEDGPKKVSPTDEP